MNRLAIIEGALALLAKPENWITHQYSSKDDTCFCLDGALRAATCRLDSQPLHNDDTPGYLRRPSGNANWVYEDTKHLIRVVLEGEDIWAFNDNPLTTHADILRVLNKAKERLSA